MKYHQIDKNLFINNRKRFIKYLDKKSLAVFNSNDIYNTGADSTLPFVQHRDIFHLCGVDQEESILVIFPDCNNESHREILFLKETNEQIAVWEGEKLTKEKAMRRKSARRGVRCFCSATLRNKSSHHELLVNGLQFHARLCG